MRRISLWFVAIATVGGVIVFTATAARHGHEEAG